MMAALVVIAGLVIAVLAPRFGTDSRPGFSGHPHPDAFPD